MDEHDEHGREATERERSTAEMEALHLAMMEELGIGRKDALPLEDRAANNSIVPLIIPSKCVGPENPASIWHNLNLDDAEPGAEDLEDIAGGQLYRLRRGGSGLSNGGRGGHSAGRGRGGASSRGGHSSVGGRGNFAARGRDIDPSRSGQPYFNDARRGGRSPAKVDAGIARLQREAEFRRTHPTGGHSIKMPPSAPRSAKSVARAAAPAVARATSPAVTQHITSKFKLAPPSAFLSHYNIGYSPAVRVAEPVLSAPPPNAGNGISASSPASKLAPQGGLATSRWASATKHVDTPEANNLEQFVAPETPTITFAASHVAQQITPVVVMNASESNQYVRSATSALSANASESNHSAQSTVRAPLTIATQHNTEVNRSVVDERTVKVSNNKIMGRLATAKLIKIDGKLPLILEIHDGSGVILSEVLTETATLKVDTNVVTYQSGSTTGRTSTWRLQFQLPGPALDFVNHHNFGPSELRRIGYPSRSSEQGKQSSPMPVSSAPLSPAPSSAISCSSNATSRNDVAYFTNRISSATFADLSQLNGQETLLSLSDEESQPGVNLPPTYSSFQDLLSLMEVDIVEGTLQVLNANHGGSFFDHVSQLAKGIGLENDAHFMKHAKNVFVGGLSSSRYSRSKPILSITEGLVSDFLSKSDTLQKFPQEFIDTYIKEISKKILDKAQNPQDGAKSETGNSIGTSNAVEAGQLVDVSEVLEPIKPVESIQLVEATKPAIAIKSACASDLGPRQKRITYSIKELITMRPGARLTGEMIDARDSLGKYLPGRKQQYKDSHRASATKLQPSEWKSQSANTVSNHEVSQAVLQSETIEEQKPGQTSFVPASLCVGNANHVSSSDGAHLQDSFDKRNGTSFSKLSPAELEVQSGSTLGNLAPSNIAKVENESTDNGALVSISAEKISRPSSDICHQSLFGDSSGISSIATHAQNNDVSKRPAMEAESEVTAKAESENKTSPLEFPSLSTSRYATPDVFNQVAVLRAASAHKPSPHLDVKRPSLSRSSVSSTSLRSTQLNDTTLWETLLSSKQIQPSIKVESSEALKNELEDVTFTPELEKSIPVTISHESALEPNPEIPPTQHVFKVDNASNIGQVPEFKADKQKQAPVACEKITEKEMAVPKFDYQLSAGSRHVATNSEINRLAQALSNLGVKAGKDNDLITDVVPVQERSISPTIEEILEKKRGNGLASSKWASPQAPVFKPTPAAPKSIFGGYHKLGSNKPRRDDVFYPYYNPAMQAQSPYGDFLQHGEQYHSPQGQTPNGFSSPPVDQKYPVQHMQSQQPLAPVLSTILVTDPATGLVKEMTGVLQQTHVPVVTHMPHDYVGQSPAGGTGFTSFPPRPTMFDRSFSDSDGEDVLKATAPVFTPSHQRDGSNLARSALSPVFNRQNAQQEAIQARLNQSLAEKRT
ncbi:hypothetical protein DSL72_001269 [Monilinia vaccinii-corymbosi]|uniref:Uncharacterized protein n=1 Tax=Monilinia vaccinii-corymbosi TaxID=61207 RepID=A0A8A3P3J0_9HELO|nr:hypothetical protein DSL72_001269 [Monilinia vaccinii-corymbosi]